MLDKSDGERMLLEHFDRGFKEVFQFFCVDSVKTSKKVLDAIKEELQNDLCFEFHSDDCPEGSTVAEIRRIALQRYKEARRIND